jgi:hypothetical protein
MELVESPQGRARRIVALHTQGIVCLGEVWNLFFAHITPDTLSTFMAEITPEVDAYFRDAVLSPQFHRNERDRALFHSLMAWYEAKTA